MADDATQARQQAIEAIEAIEAYLSLHPKAADTAGGIAQWWLPEMGVDVPIEQVVQALEVLQHRNAVVRTVLPDGQAIYGGPHDSPHGKPYGRAGP